MIELPYFSRAAVCNRTLNKHGVDYREPIYGVYHLKVDVEYRNPYFYFLLLFLFLVASLPFKP